jgi:imidazolonepropionase
MSRLLMVNIGELVVVPPGPVPGARMDNVARIGGAELLISNGRIAAFGPVGASGDTPADCEIVDALGGCVVPGLIDCHTHAVFAGLREDEFVKRIRGKSYAQIAAEGGGIRTSVDALREASREQLVELTLPRLRRMLAGGVTTVEIKSGYGLTLADERKMLEAVDELRTRQHLELVGTYLAAHVVPRKRGGARQAYLEETYADAVLADLCERGLAEFGDVFCEEGAYTLEEARFVAEACLRNGLGFKIHAEQLSNLGAARMAAELGAVSADHLEYADQATMQALRAAGTIPVLLPGCSLFLDSDPAPAREMIEAGLPVALATDYNPGSAMIESLPLVMSYACLRLRMTPSEALVACTANAAAALRRADRVGGVAEGMQADLVVLDVPRLEAWPYQVGRNCVSKVIKRGRVVVDRPGP